MKGGGLVHLQIDTSHIASLVRFTTKHWSNGNTQFNCSSSKNARRKYKISFYKTNGPIIFFLILSHRWPDSWQNGLPQHIFSQQKSLPIDSHSQTPHKRGSWQPSQMTKHGWLMFAINFQCVLWLTVIYCTLLKIITHVHVIKHSKTWSNLIKTATA